MCIHVVYGSWKLRLNAATATDERNPVDDDNYLNRLQRNLSRIER